MSSSASDADGSGGVRRSSRPRRPPPGFVIGDMSSSSESDAGSSSGGVGRSSRPRGRSGQKQPTSSLADKRPTKRMKKGTSSSDGDDEDLARLDVSGYDVEFARRLATKVVEAYVQACDGVVMPANYMTAGLDYYGVCERKLFETAALKNKSDPNLYSDKFLLFVRMNNFLFFLQI